MDQNLTTIITSLIAVLFGGGAWKFYEFLIKKKSNEKKEEKSEQTMYRDDLIKRVEDLQKAKERCSASLMEISKDLAAITVELAFIKRENERLKYK